MCSLSADPRTPATAAPRVRTRLSVAGAVQGVGFRPHVARLAADLKLGGHVRNDGGGVLIEAEGAPGAIEEFCARVIREQPRAALVERWTRSPLNATGAATFEIRPSTAVGFTDPFVPLDRAACDACVAEVFDPGDRRHRYPFASCAECGPRFTITTGLPFDRRQTTMSSFALCKDCRREYEDPADRRFHAQTIACPACGPQVMLVDRSGRRIDAADAPAAAAAALADGAIVAVKGIGGYHLACRADREEAVAELRERKRRPAKPFAVMVGDLAAAATLANLSADEERLLCGPERPIVIASARDGNGLAETVAPGCPEIGLLLAYSPLHHLLLAGAAGPLVMTSGNLSDEPIAYRDEDALRRLGTVADLFLMGERPIASRCDDSVYRGTAVLRRSRGLSPAPLQMPVSTRPVLAVGAELKNTFTLASGGRAWVGPHIGDLGRYEALITFREAVARAEGMLAVEPEAVACDLHPDYGSTTYAEERGLEVVRVPHHHAHMSAVLAEHGETGAAVGAIYDGAGFGPDGTVWGGEILAGTLAGTTRAAHLHEVGLPGGDVAAQEPWRMACSWLAALHESERPPLPAILAPEVEGEAWELVARLSRSNLAPRTSSMGRLFDAAAALCGLRPRSQHEAQAAMELEWVADGAERSAYTLPVVPAAGASPPTLDPRETLASLTADLDRGTPRALVAARFHNAVAEATAGACALAAGDRTETVVLGGGVFANRLLLARTTEALRARGLRALAPCALPAGDGGISFGQAVTVAARAT